MTLKCYVLQLKALGFAYLNNTVNTIKVPIYLDIFYYGWDELHEQNNTTITVVNKEENNSQNVAILYQAIVCFLWQKNILFFNKLNYDKEVITEIVSAI